MKRRRINFKSILGIVLIIILAFAVIGGIGSCAKDETDNISMFEFERGELDKNGKHVSSKRAIYTKSAFACLGLECVPDFDGQISYAVYYYDANGNFIDSVTEITGTYTYDHPFATHARVVIYPDVPESDDEEDFKIAFYEVYSIAKKLDISVSKKQSSAVNLYVDSNSTAKKSFNYGDDGKTLTLFDSNVQKVSEYIKVEHKKYDVYFRWTEEFVDYSAAVVITSGNSVVKAVNEEMAGYTAGEWVHFSLELDSIEEDYQLVVKLPIDADCYIFGYK